MAREIIKEMFNPEIITQPDWMFKFKGKWCSSEVKHKERFMPPPFEGHGLEAYQARYRMQLYKDTGIICLFLVIEKPSNAVFVQWLNRLEQGDHFDTRNGIRIYKLTNFKKYIGRGLQCEKV